MPTETIVLNWISTGIVMIVNSNIKKNKLEIGTYI